MKRLLSIVLTIAFLAGSVCGCKTGTVNGSAGTTAVGNETENSTEEESGAAEVAEEKNEESVEKTGESLKIEEKMTPLYVFSMKNEEVMPLYFISGSEIPYVDIENFAGFMTFIVSFGNVSRIILA